MTKTTKQKTAYCENCGARYFPGHKCTSPYDVGAGSGAGAEAFRKTRPLKTSKGD